MLTTETVVQATPEQISSQIADNETIILGLKQSAYFGLNEVATRIWQQIQRPTAISTIVSNLLEDYEVTPDVCLSKTLDFLHMLLQADLLNVVSSPDAIMAPDSETTR